MSFTWPPTEAAHTQATSLWLQRVQTYFFAGLMSQPSGVQVPDCLPLWLLGWSVNQPEVTVGRWSSTDRYVETARVRARLRPIH